MASIVTYKDGLRRVEFSLSANGPRKAVRLGRVSAKVAAACKARIESIVNDKMLSRPHDAEIAAWLAGLDETMLARLRAVGLADGVGVSRTTLGALLERCFDTLTSKPATRTFYSHTRRNLEEHFGPGRLLGDIAAADADGFRAWLVENERLSPATVARRIIACRTIWKRAVRWKLATDNPFAGVKAGHQANDARKRYIPPEVIDAVIAAAPDAEWRVIIALARYGGLRTPSETYALRWGDIDWERGTVRVTCPKLARIERCAFRTLPLFPELRDRLLTLFAETPDGTEYVVSRHRLDSLNLRQRFEKIITRAGAQVWPRLFHNLRASRESELMRDYDLATVCRWIGNSPACAATHYATSIDLDADFRRATGRDMQAAESDAAKGQQKGQQKAQQSAAANETREESLTPPECNKPRGKAEKDDPRLCAASAGKDGGWAIRDSNP